MYICSALFLFFRSLFVSRISLATETLVLRQQLLVLNRTVKRPKLRRRDRLFLVCLSKLWVSRESSLYSSSETHKLFVWRIRQRDPSRRKLTVNLLTVFDFNFYGSLLTEGLLVSVILTGWGLDRIACSKQICHCRSYPRTSGDG